MGTLQLRRLTTTNRLLIIPANGEPIYDLDLKIIYIGDGSTLGGVNPIATTNEVITGSDGTRIVTPAGLTSKIDTDISLAGNSNTRIASQAATKAYVDALAGSINALIYKGVIDCSTTPNYPAADAGHVYIVSVAGKIGGASGTVVAAGDLLLCKVDSSAAGTEAAVGANWDVLEKNIDLTNILISGGAIDNTLIGNTTPAMGRFSPLKAKGPAIITTFAGTISTSGSSTTITFTSAADAILAGYDANNPLLGTTLITTAVNQASVTRYVQSWTNSTQCVVDTACTLAASSTLASVQAPIMVFVNSAGVVQGWMNAAGKIYCVGNLGIGNANPSSIVSMYKSSGSVQFEIASGTTLSYIGPSSSTWDIWSQANFPFVITMNSAELFRVLTNGNFLIGGITAAGTSGAKVLGLGEGTAPTTSPADMSQLWSADIGGATQSFNYKNASFAYNQASYFCLIKKLRG